MQRMIGLGVSQHVGVDAVEPLRLQQRLARNPRLEHELFTLGERAYCLAQPEPIQHFAARFCAKEAVVKALALDGFDPLEIEVTTPSPAPGIRLHGAVAARAMHLKVRVTVSLTHLETFAIAVAVTDRMPLRDCVHTSLRALRTASPFRRLRATQPPHEATDR